jgi:monovalent cation/hydrogen antiporter
VGQAKLLIAGLLVAVAGLSVLARRLSVPYPIMLVAGGALFGFIPGLPEVKLNPQVVLVVFLPPLVYGAAINANFNDFRANLRTLTISTVALVLATMGAVAWAAHELIPGLSWAAAFVLGAIVSPTDPLAAAAIMRRRPRNPGWDPRIRCKGGFRRRSSTNGPRWRPGGQSHPGMRSHGRIAPPRRSSSASSPAG